MSEPKMTRDEKVDLMVDYYIRDINATGLLGDNEFLAAVLSGEGWKPFNQLTDEQVDVEWNELSEYFDGKVLR